MYDAKLRNSPIRACCTSPSAAGRTQPWSPNIISKQRSYSASTTIGFLAFDVLLPFQTKLIAIFEEMNSMNRYFRVSERQVDDLLTGGW
jgi:hypothetical protein